MQKHQWRKKEKPLYLPKSKPEVIKVPSFKFVSVTGQGNPNSPFFADYITVLYSISYAIKMTLKKMEAKPDDYCDYTVYPLEGVWDITDEAKKDFDGTLNKDDFVFDLMIRQPDFVSKDFFEEMLVLTKQKKPSPLLEKVKFKEISDGTCVQMMYIGPYDDEPASFEMMEAFAAEHGLERLSKRHREIYISDFRKVAPEKLKTVLRFKTKQ